MTTTLKEWGAAARLADEQWGLVTTAQAGALGVSRSALGRWAEAGVLERVSQGVYGFPGATDSAVVLDRALWLSLDPDRTHAQRLLDPVSAGVLSHTTAARVLGLGSLLDSRSVVTLPTARRVRRPDLDLRVGVLEREDVELVQGLPVTTPARTVRDLLASGADLDHVADVLGDALHSRIVPLGVLGDSLDPIAPARGFDDGRSLLDHLLELAAVSLDDLAVAQR